MANKKMTSKKQTTPSKSSQPTPKKNAPRPNGTYFEFGNGRVGRTYPLGPYESMDTTGYGKGKKEFDLMTSYSGYKPTSQKVQRKDVPSTINRLKSGATRTESYPKKKK